GTRADVHPLRVDAVALGEPRAHAAREGIRVAVGFGRGDRRHDRRMRRVRVLIRRQLEGIRRRRLALLVGDGLQDLGADANGGVVGAGHAVNSIVRRGQTSRFIACAGGDWDSGRMRFIVRLLINAFALWLTTLIVAAVDVVSFEEGDTTPTVLTFLL